MGPPMGRANVKTKEEVISKPKEAISSQVEFLFFLTVYFMIHLKQVKPYSYLPECVHVQASR